jgi:hypothetical protein
MNCVVCLQLAASLWDQNSVIAPSKDCFAVDGMKRFLDSEPMDSFFAKCQDADDEEKPEDINNIKRIKIDDMAAEKNMRRQAKLKVNVEQNATRSAAQPAVSNPSIFSGFGDQLCASPLSTASSASVSDNASLLQPEASSSASVCGTVEGLLQMQYVRSSERAWQAYTSRNQSIVVRTFQGQFKSTVSVSLVGCCRRSLVGLRYASLRKFISFFLYPSCFNDCQIVCPFRGQASTILYVDYIHDDYCQLV